MKKGIIRWVAMLLIACLLSSSLEAAIQPFSLRSANRVPAVTFKHQALVSAALLTLHPLSVEASAKARQAISAPVLTAGSAPNTQWYISIAATTLVISLLVGKLVYDLLERREKERRRKLFRVVESPMPEIVTHPPEEPLFQRWRLQNLADQFHVQETMRYDVNLILESMGISGPVHIEEYVEEDSDVSVKNGNRVLRILPGRRAEDNASQVYVTIWYGSRSPRVWDPMILDRELHALGKSLPPGGVLVYLNPWDEHVVRQFFRSAYGKRVVPASRVEVFNPDARDPDRPHAFAFVKKELPPLRLISQRPPWIHSVIALLFFVPVLGALYTWGGVGYLAVGMTAAALGMAGQLESLNGLMEKAFDRLQLPVSQMNEANQVEAFRFASRAAHFSHLSPRGLALANKVRALQYQGVSLLNVSTVRFNKFGGDTIHSQIALREGIEYLEKAMKEARSGKVYFTALTYIPFSLGHAYHRNGEHDKAIQILETGIELCSALLAAIDGSEIPEGRISVNQALSQIVEVPVFTSPHADQKESQALLREHRTSLETLRDQIKAAKPAPAAPTIAVDAPVGTVALRERNRALIQSEVRDEATLNEISKNADDVIARAGEVPAQTDWLIMEGLFQSGYAAYHLGRLNDAQTALESANRKIPFPAELRLSILNTLWDVYKALGAEQSFTELNQSLENFCLGILNGDRNALQDYPIPSNQLKLIRSNVTLQAEVKNVLKKIRPGWEDVSEVKREEPRRPEPSRVLERPQRQSQPVQADPRSPVQREDRSIRRQQQAALERARAFHREGQYAEASESLKAAGESSEVQKFRRENERALERQTRRRAQEDAFKRAQALHAEGQYEMADKALTEAGDVQGGEAFRQRNNEVWQQAILESQAQLTVDHVLGTDVLGESLKQRLGAIGVMAMAEAVSVFPDRVALLVDWLSSIGLAPEVLRALAVAASERGDRSFSFVQELLGDLKGSVLGPFLIQSIAGFVRAGLGDDEVLEKTVDLVAAKTVRVSVLTQDLGGKIKGVVGASIHVEVPRARSGEVKQGDVYAAIVEKLKAREDIHRFIYTRSGQLRTFRLTVNGKDAGNNGWESRKVPANAKFAVRIETETAGQHEVTKAGLSGPEEEKLAEHLLNTDKAQFVSSLDGPHTLITRWAFERPSQEVEQLFKLVPKMKELTGQFLAYLKSSQPEKIEYRGRQEPAFRHENTLYQIIYLPADVSFEIHGKKVGAFKRLRDDGVLQIFIHPALDGFLHEVAEHLVLPYLGIAFKKRHLYALLFEILAGGEPITYEGSRGEMKIPTIFPARITGELQKMTRPYWLDISANLESKRWGIRGLFNTPEEEPIRIFFFAFIEALANRAQRLYQEDQTQVRVSEHLKGLDLAIDVYEQGGGGVSVIHSKLALKYSELFELKGRSLYWASQRRVAQIAKNDEQFLKKPIYFTDTVTVILPGKKYSLIPDLGSRRYVLIEEADSATSAHTVTGNFDELEEIEALGAPVRIMRSKDAFILEITNHQSNPLEVLWTAPRQLLPRAISIRSDLWFVPFLLPTLWLGRLWAEAHGHSVTELPALGAFLLTPGLVRSINSRSKQLLSAA